MIRVNRVLSTGFAVDLSWLTSRLGVNWYHAEEHEKERAMARPKHRHPTPAELEVLQKLWSQGPLTVREVMEQLAQPSRPRSYTTVMSLLEVMYEKGLVRRKSQGRAYIYSACADANKTLGGLLGDLLRRGFQGSASALVSHLLNHASPDEVELREIRHILESHERNQVEAREDGK